MLERAIASKYSRALFDSTEEEKVSEQVGKEIEAVAALMEAEQDLRKILLSPKVLPKTKLELLEKILKDRISPALLRFLQLLVRKRRFKFLTQISEDYSVRLRQARGVVRAIVTTAVPIDDTLSQRFRTALERLTGKTIELELEVDPELIGGAVVVLRHEILDRSIRTELQIMREELSGVMV